MAFENEYPYSIRDVHISDPFILVDEKTGFYYTYVQFADTERFPQAKVDEPCFYVLRSPDLINWTAPKVCFRKGDFWADLDYWAPECHIWNGRYYLISSFRAEGKYRGCQCLAADDPEGPFTPVGEGPITPKGWHCLDGTLFTDAEGEPWLVFCHEWMQVYDGQICAVRLNRELSEAVSEPEILFRASDAPWRGDASADGGLVTDGPFLYRMKSGTLIMLWSSFSGKGGYTVGYARSATGTIHGPWIQEKIPLYALDGGHAVLFKSFNGKLMMSLHCPNIHPKKRILLFEMNETGNRLEIKNEITGNWYNNAGGNAEHWRYKSPCTEPFYFDENTVNQYQGV